jgi:HSP20 family molecular chaperone IbpA
MGCPVPFVSNLLLLSALSVSLSSTRGQPKRPSISVGLRGGIQEDKVEASFKNGVLTVTLPKSEDARPNVRRIAVNSN